MGSDGLGHMVLKDGGGVMILATWFRRVGGVRVFLISVGRVRGSDASWSHSL